MPIFDEGGDTGASYQSAWEAFTGLFDKDRWGEPEPQDKPPEGEESGEKKKKKSGKWF